MGTTTSGASGRKPPAGPASVRVPAIDRNAFCHPSSPLVNLNPQIFSMIILWLKKYGFFVDVGCCLSLFYLHIFSNEGYIIIKCLCEVCSSISIFMRHSKSLQIHSTVAFSHHLPYQRYHQSFILHLLYFPLVWTRLSLRHVSFVSPVWVFFCIAWPSTPKVRFPNCLCVILNIVSE